MDSSHPLTELTSSSRRAALESGDEPRLFMCSALYLAVCHGRNEEVMALLLQQHGGKAPAADHQATGIQHGQCDIHETSPEGNNLFHLAAEQGHDEMIRELYSRFGDKSLLSCRNSELDMPLHCAARAGRDTTVSLLIQLAGDSRDSNILCGKNEAGDTILHLAARHGHGATVEAVVSGAPELASEVNNAGLSPLYLAVISRSMPAVKAITAKCRDASGVGPSSQNALHAAVFQDSDMVNLILQWKPSLADQVDDSSSSPLHFASSRGDRSVINAILRAAPPSSVYKQDSEGLSAFHVAAQMGHAGIVKDLIETYPEAAELRDNHGRIFLHSAAKRGDSEVMSVAIKNPKIGHRLLNVQDRDGNTPLHLAVEASSSRVVQALMFKGKVQANIMNNDGKMPYDLAVKSTSAFKVVSLVMTLTVFGAQSRPQRQDHVQQWSGRDVGQGIERTSDSLAVIAVLIATVAFGAAFNIPGSYENNGLAVLNSLFMFKCFLVLDSVALTTSVLAVILLVFGKASRSIGSWNSLVAASHLIWISLISMILAFYAALAAVTCTKAIYPGTFFVIYQLFYISVVIITRGIAPEASFRTCCKFLFKGRHDVFKRRTGRQYPFIRAYIVNLTIFILVNSLAFLGMFFIGFSAEAAGCSRVSSLIPAPAPTLL